MNDFDNWKSFIKQQGIFDISEMNTLTYCIGIFSNDELIATGALATNVLKYIVIDPQFRCEGKTFNRILSDLINKAATMNIFHLLVSTKLIYQKSFEYVGFKKIVSTNQGLLLEKGPQTIDDFISHIKKVENQTLKKVAAIVMNANPFTKGHRYLVEKAAMKNDLVYVFIVNQNVSLFTTAERIKMAQNGLSDLTNVIVVNGGDYIISYATFPAYFIQQDELKVTYQSSIDALIFKKYFAHKLNICNRYVGSEPYSTTTNSYNQVLKAELPPEVRVTEILRISTNAGKIITATDVRKAISENKLYDIYQLVPEATFEFIKSNFKILQKRLKGMKINEY